MSLLRELNRRNVFRVGAAYVVIGWLVLQVADVVLGFTGAPEWVGKTLIALLLLGFVPALALAWVFEVGPSGVHVDRGAADAPAAHGRRLDLITLVAVFGVVVMMAWQHLGPGRRDAATPTQQATPAPVDPAPAPARSRPEPPPLEAPPGSIAVLPFTNRSAEPDTAYFVDGVHDDLLTQLARNAALKVISRTSMLEYRDTTKNVRQIGAELGVAAILEGAVQRAGKRVRINAQLIDTGSDEHLWAETFDRELTPENVFDIQSEIAQAIATALGRTLVSRADRTQGAAPTQVAAAYDAYLQARALRDTQRTPELMTAAAALYRQAIELDPTFALAMGELAKLLVELHWYGNRDPLPRDESRLWIERALALQPDSPRLQLIMGEHRYRGWLDYEGALEWLDKAEQGLPGSGELFALRGFIARRAGQAHEALAALEKAAALDPRSGQVLSSLVETHGLLGDVAQAQTWDRRLAALPGATADDRSSYALARLGVLGDPQAMAALIGELPQDVAGYQQYRFLLPYRRGDHAAAAQAIDALPDDPIEDQFAMLPKALLRARLALALGEREAVAGHAASALALVEAELKADPANHRAMLARAQALAFLGRDAEARAALASALDQPAPRRDWMLRAEMQLGGLQVVALLGDGAELAAAIERYLALPLKFMHFDGLMADPLLAAHRDHPDMVALAAKHSRG